MMKMLMGMVTTIQELLVTSFASDIAVFFFVMCHESSDDFECGGRAGFNRGHHCLTIASPEGFEHSFLLLTLMSDGPGQRGEKLGLN